MKVRTDSFRIRRDGYDGKYWTAKRKVRRCFSTYWVNTGTTSGIGWYHSPEEALAAIKEYCQSTAEYYQVTYLPSKARVVTLDLTKELK